MPSYKKSMTSQLVLMVAIAITIMQLYKFYLSWEILDIFNTLSSMVLWAYFRGMLNEVPDKKNVDVEQPNLHDINDLQNVG